MTRLLLLCLLLAASSVANATASDIYTFTPPAGWTQQSTAEHSGFSTIDRSTGAFCVIGAYASTQGSGDPVRDFASEWIALVQHSTGIRMPSDVRDESWRNGWQLLSGTGEVVSTVSGTYTTTLYVHSGPDRAFSIMVNESKGGCGNQVQAFLSGIRLNGEPAVVPPPAPQPYTPPADSAHGGVGKRFGEVGFRLPDGWNLLSSSAFAGANLGRHVELQPRNLYPGENLTVIVFDALPATRSTEEEMKVAWEDVVAQLGATATNTAYMRHYDLVDIARYPNGSWVAKGDGAIDMADGHYDMTLYIVQLNGRIIRVAAIAHWLKASFLRMSALGNPRFMTSIPRLLLDLDIQGQHLGQQPIQPANAKPILGMWNGISMFGGLLKETYAYFYPDGIVYFSSHTPMQGFLDLDREADLLRSRFYWGTYSFDGKSGEISLPGRKAVFPMRLSGDALVINAYNAPHDFIRLPSMNDYRLQGTYGFKLTDGSFANIRFSADSHFVDEGALKVLGHEVYQFTVTGQPGSGRYRISDYTLVLNYDDGRKFQLPFLGSSDLHSSTPGEIRVGMEDSRLVRR
ncbi:MAG TPA: hypothetical protein VNI58_10675 [Mariprofundaceae bacterium]|nr:hypothetical protein [Mariprofundaceae bacterium]